MVTLHLRPSHFDCTYSVFLLPALADGDEKQ